MKKVLRLSFSIGLIFAVVGCQTTMPKLYRDLEIDSVCGKIYKKDDGAAYKKCQASALKAAAELDKTNFSRLLIVSSLITYGALIVLMVPIVLSKTPPAK